ncbi:MAG: penicillin-binding protein 1C, partial [Luteimonas sp.]
HGTLLRLALADDQRYRLWLPLTDISPLLVDGVLLHEDAWFRWHPGVNPVSLARAAWSTSARDATRIGGSTLTMQLARLRWRLDTRSPRGKLVQLARALQLEACYSKDAILEAYLNLAPYGGNIEGVGAASLIYFRAPAASLTLPEALTLAVLPQAPTRRGRLRGGGDGTASYAGAGLSAARARLYARWRARHPPDPASDALMALPLSLRAPRALPFAAEHFVQRVLAERGLHPDAGPQLRTTLDLRLQRLVEERLRSHVARLHARGLHNASALLIDSRDMGVRALVGSADFFDAGIDGQVDGSDAKRSPGSTLKPFIYGLALDQGLLHPATVLRDVPSAFGPYTPENFDGRFLGPVTAADALVRSRNIPAVTVAAQLQQPSFYQFLRDAGIARMASERHYGLALVLGGGEVTMQELARLYAMLGNDGLLRPLRWRMDDARVGGSAALSSESAFIVRDMLTRNPRPDFSASSGTREPAVAWKTGTSWAFRDAWSAGIVGPYVLVVWVGNFDGSPNPALIGVETAAPLFFSIVDGLRAARVNLSEPLRRWPLNLKRVEVCSASGDLPNAECPRRRSTWFIPGKSPIRISRVHRTVNVDIASGRAACGPFDPSRMRREVFEFWPSDLARVFAQAGIPRRAPPANADCAIDTGLGSPPRIQSPLRAARYTLRLSRPQQAAIALSASVDADVSRVFWFAGDSFIAATAAGDTATWSPGRAGSFRLSAVDDHGRADTRDVTVDVVQ